MDENNKNEEFKVEVNKEELKNQTKETVNQVKETVKNINFKKDAKATKGFILKMIQNPVSTIKEVVEEKENHFSMAIILLLCFIVVYGVFGIIDRKKIVGFVSPIIFVLSITASIFLFGGKEKKSITTILSGVCVSVTPMIFAYLIGLVSEICGNPAFLYALYRSAKVATTAIFAILVYFAVKGLITTENDEDKCFRKYAIIMLFSQIIVALFDVLDIYIIL